MDPSIDVHFQPIIDLHSERIVGAEALMRLEGRPPTKQFLDKISWDHELGADVSARVLLEAFDLLGRLPGECDWYATVNIPADILGSRLILEKVDFDAHPLEIRQRVVVEVTERQGLHENAWAAVAGIREYGMRLAIDDFGMGQSNLRRFLRIEPDIIKIDKTFVDPIAPAPPTERRGRERITSERRLAEKVIRAIATLARMMETRSVAEGIEHPEQATILRAVGVDYGQGWLWHKAMPGPDLLALWDPGAEDEV